MLRILTAAIFICFFTACNNGNEEKQKPAVDSLTKLQPIVDTPTGPPLFVTGSFAGTMPCKDCDHTDRLLVLTQDTYIATEHYAGLKTRKLPIATYKGSCLQDNGFITIRDTANKPIQWYKIISKDSIEAISVSRKEPRFDKRYFLIRKDGQKIVK
jgi:hypothetical protein